MIAVVAWIVAGGSGMLLLWADMMRFDARLYHREPLWCPTPRAIIGVVVGSVFGPAGLLVGLFITFVTWQETLTKTHAWFATPICKKRED